MLNWAQQFNIFCFLDSHQYNETGEGFDCLLGAGVHSHIDPRQQPFESVDSFINTREWVFGHLSYELKNLFFPRSIPKPDRIHFPEFFFFEPEIVLAVKNGELFIYGDNPSAIFNSITSQEVAVLSPGGDATLQETISKEKYVEIVNRLKQHIQAGDCYEINFCQEFVADHPGADPYFIYNALADVSPAPFSAFYRINENYLICASPERFLSKRSSTITAQPMKGTYRRGAGSAESDHKEKQALKADLKERSENVMIVDLMRNDLSKVCKKGSVKVDELYGVYTFPQVHQMVSTVTGDLEDGMGFYDIIAASFPMGSMTGAPKHKVVELIDQYETSARGIFSGALGYFHNGDFDFNVVIRSIMYNSLEKFLSVKVGSGITIYSDPEKEWEECMVKAAAIKKVLTQGPALPVEEE
jgi:para-aminobenzoate synthetase component I